MHRVLSLPAPSSVALAVLLGLGLGGCSSSFGGGGDPPPTKVLVVPSGQAVACPDGSVPPCR